MSVNKRVILDIPCQKCGHKSPKTLGWLETNNEFTCPSCGAAIGINGPEFVGEVEQSVAKIVEGLKRSIADANR